MDRLGVSGHPPALAVEDFDSGIKFIYHGTGEEFNVGGLAGWWAGLIAGTLRPSIKSEPIPKDNSGPVKVVVADNFEEIVLDESKDVFIEFYAPWCGHCKNLAPIWEKVGTHLQGIPSVVIAKIDATSNDVPRKYGIRGFPTLLFFPANGEGKAIQYQGDRSFGSLLDFVKKNAASKFDFPEYVDDLYDDEDDDEDEDEEKKEEEDEDDDGDDDDDDHHHDHAEKVASKKTHDEL